LGDIVKILKQQSTTTHCRHIPRPWKSSREQHPSTIQQSDSSQATRHLQIIHQSSISLLSKESSKLTAAADIHPSCLQQASFQFCNNPAKKSSKVSESLNIYNKNKREIKLTYFG
jgi:hypothetical protein